MGKSPTSSLLARKLTTCRACWACQACRWHVTRKLATGDTLAESYGLVTEKLRGNCCRGIYRYRSIGDSRHAVDRTNCSHMSTFSFQNLFKNIKLTYRSQKANTVLSK